MLIIHYYLLTFFALGFIVTMAMFWYTLNIMEGMARRWMDENKDQDSCAPNWWEAQR